MANILHSLKKLINFSLSKLGTSEPFDDGDLMTYRHEHINLWPMMPTLSFRSYRRALVRLFRKAMKEQGRPDVVLAQSTVWAGSAISEELDALGIPLIVGEHAKEFLLPGGWSPLHKKLIAETYAQAGKIVANSSAVERAIIKGYPSASGKTTTIHNPVDAPTVGALPRPSVADEFRFIAVAFLRTEKRLDMLLDSFAELLKTNPNSHLTIVGGGPLHDDLIRQIAALGLTDHAYLTGYLPPDRVQEEIAKSHALVLPSDVETFGLALVEAMSHGLPVIATRCGGPEDIVTEETGLLIPTNDGEALTVAMREMIGAYYRFKGVMIRGYAAEKFGPARYVAAFEEVFAEIKGKKLG